MSESRIDAIEAMLKFRKLQKQTLSQYENSATTQQKRPIVNDVKTRFDLRVDASSAASLDSVRMAPKSKKRPLSWK